MALVIGCNCDKWCKFTSIADWSWISCNIVAKYQRISRSFTHFEYRKCHLSLVSCYLMDPSAIVLRHQLPAVVISNSFRARAFNCVPNSWQNFSLANAIRVHRVFVDKVLPMQRFPMLFCLSYTVCLAIFHKFLTQLNRRMRLCAITSFRSRFVFSPRIQVFVSLSVFLALDAHIELG